MLYGRKAGGDRVEIHRSGTRMCDAVTAEIRASASPSQTLAPAAPSWPA